MNQACLTWHVPNPTVADVVLQLRERLGLTQSELAKRAGLDRVEIAKLEMGANKATTERMRAALAQGFGLSREVLANVLEGRISVDEAVAAPSAPAKVLTRTGPRLVQSQPYPHRDAFVRLGREQGLDASILEIIASETHFGGEPGRDYWRERYKELRAERRQIAELKDDEGPDPSTLEVLAKRKRKPR
jgi:transcriptional regulator with XRE-family HTH domain